LFDRREPGHALLLRAAPAGQGASSQKSLAFAGEEVLGKFYGDCQGHGWFANASNDIWRIGVGSLVVAFWGTL
jgi:hypothetical protein